MELTNDSPAVDSTYMKSRNHFRNRRIRFCGYLTNEEAASARIFRITTKHRRIIPQPATNTLTYRAARGTF
jgi:hypothetical protein